jgi:hypothetical protein
MKKLFIVLLVSALPFSLFAQAPAKGPLDGKVYETEVQKVKEEKKKPLTDEPDEFKFAQGKFKTKFFSEQYKFKQALYTIISIDSSNVNAKIITWRAECTNDIKDVVTWEGTITGEEIEGTGELVDVKGKKKFSYEFKGKLKKKPGQK